MPHVDDATVNGATVDYATVNGTTVTFPLSPVEFWS
jgi:hypothetical protein